MMRLIQYGKWLVLLVTLVTILVFSGFIALYLYVGPQLPNVQSLRDMQLQTPMSVYTADGELMAEFGEKRRIPVRLDEVPETFIQALLATEDARFYEHSGVDFKGVLRSVVNLITTGRKSQGASTITMLVARNVYLSREKTFTRKFTEMFLAWKIESELSKDEILELFLNKAHFGHRAYGIGAAAQVYYGKSLQELTLPQLAVLAGIPKGESKYNPLSYPHHAKNRRNHVLGRMLDENYISEAQYQQASQASISAKKHGAEITVSAPYLAEMVRRQIIDRFGKEQAYTAGLKVVTTVKASQQYAAQKSLRRGLIDYDERHGYRGAEAQWELPEAITEDSLNELAEALTEVPTVGGLYPALVLAVEEQSAQVLLDNGEQAELSWEGMSWAKPYINDDRTGKAPTSAFDVVNPGDLIRVFKHEEQLRLTQVPQASAGLVALDAEDGAVIALVGGFDYYLNKFNLVTQARRQPGSNIKPFVYSSALAKGFTTASIINDAPFVETDRTAENVWRPKNDSGRYRGPTRLRDALRLSNNMVSIRLMKSIEPKYAQQYLTRFGFEEKYMPAYPSLALGAASFTPMEVVTGYAVFANGGYRVQPYFIQRVEDADGQVLYEADPVRVCRDCPQEPSENDNSADVPQLAAASELQVKDALNTQSSPGLLTVSEQPDLPISNEPQFSVAESKRAERVLDERIAFLMDSMMEDVVQRGTAWRPLHNSGSYLLRRGDVAGKTGTTNDARDAWFSGYADGIVATSWVGFNDHTRSLGSREYGGKAALPIWQGFMEHALRDRPARRDTMPAGIVQVRIDPETGLLAPAGMDGAIFEYFRVEEVPTDYAAPNLVDPFNTDEDPNSGVESIF